jgi:hypothetical protein
MRAGAAVQAELNARKAAVRRRLAVLAGVCRSRSCDLRRSCRPRLMFTDRTCRPDGPHRAGAVLTTLSATLYHQVPMPLYRCWRQVHPLHCEVSQTGAAHGRVMVTALSGTVPGGVAAYCQRRTVPGAIGTASNTERPPTQEPPAPPPQQAQSVRCSFHTQRIASRWLAGCRAAVLVT